MYDHNVNNCINLNIPVPILLVSAFSTTALSIGIYKRCM